MSDYARVEKAIRDIKESAVGQGGNSV